MVVPAAGFPQMHLWCFPPFPPIDNLHLMKFTFFKEMQAIERVPPTLGPAVADLASEAGTWCKEFLDSETHVEVGS